MGYTVELKSANPNLSAELEAFATGALCGTVTECHETWYKCKIPQACSGKPLCMHTYASAYIRVCMCACVYRLLAAVPTHTSGAHDGPRNVHIPRIRCSRWHLQDALGLANIFRTIENHREELQIQVMHPGGLPAWPCLMIALWVAGLLCEPDDARADLPALCSVSASCPHVVGPMRCCVEG